MYYKKYLPLIGEIDICKLNECIVTKITANNESFFDMSLQITKSQSNAVWVLLQKPHRCASSIDDQQPARSILVGDFNAKLSKWCSSDKDTKTGQGIDTFTTTLIYTQMTGQPTDIINDKSWFTFYHS